MKTFQASEVSEISDIINNSIDHMLTTLVDRDLTHSSIENDKLFIAYKLIEEVMSEAKYEIERKLSKF